MRFFFGSRVSCTEGRELRALMYPNISKDIFPSAQQQMKMSFKAWLTDSVGNADCCCYSGTACHGSVISLSLKSLAQDLPPKLLLFKTQPWPPSKPKCVVTVRVWPHVNCCSVLGGHLKTWTVDNEQHRGVSASCPVSQPLTLAVPGTMPFHFLSLFFPLPWRTPFVLDVTQLHSFLWTNIMCRCLILGDG